MYRRNFLIGFLTFPTFYRNLKAKSISIVHQNNTNSFSDKEIMGLEEPLLCGDQFCLRNEAMEAYIEMQFEAQKSGVSLWCPSAYRDFNYQKNIWNAKYRALIKSGFRPQFALKEILKYSSLPGTSRHHWGTDIDIVDAISYQIQNPLSENNFKPEGEYQYLKYWLNENAHRFGYYEVYTSDTSRTGFKYEPWHYSFAPTSKNILKQLISIDFSTIEELNLCKGYEYFDKAFFEKYKKEYILGINKILIEN